MVGIATLTVVTSNDSLAQCQSIIPINPINLPSSNLLHISFLITYIIDPISNVSSKGHDSDDVPRSFTPK